MTKRRINTFSQTLTLEQAEREKALGTSIGQVLLKADKLYEKRRQK